MMRLSLLLLLVFASCNKKKKCFELYEGSIAIAANVGDTIYLIADSKAINMMDAGQFNNSFNNVCKIGYRENMIYSMTGLYKSDNPDVEPRRILNKIKFSNRDIFQRLSLIKKVLYDSLLSVAKSIKRDKPKYFLDSAHQGLFTMMIGMYEKQKLVLGYIGFTIKQDENTDIRLQTKIDTSGKFPIFLCSGEKGAYNEIFSTWKNQAISKSSTLSILKFIVKQQSVRTPSIVNNLTDIIYLTKKNQGWIERRQECF